MAGVSYSLTPSMLGGEVDADGLITGGKRNDTEQYRLRLQHGAGQQYFRKRGLHALVERHLQRSDQLAERETGSKNRYFNHTGAGQPESASSRWASPSRASAAYSQYIGFTNDYSDDSYLLCNAWLGKKVFKNKRGEVMFGVNDLLNQQPGLRRARRVRAGRRTATNSVIGRYYMVQFTYNLRRFGKKGSKNISTITTWSRAVREPAPHGTRRSGRAASG